MNEVLPRAQAQKLKNEVLEKFKERIISRADIIDKRIKEEKALVRVKLDLIECLARAKSETAREKGRRK